MADVNSKTPDSATNGTPVPTVPLKNRYLAAFLAYLVPGLGHAYQGRYGKAVLYAVCIGFLFTVGMILGDGKILYWRWVNPMVEAERFCFWYFAQFFAGLAALPALIQATLTHYGMPTILWGYGADPSVDMLNGPYPRFGKLVEIGYIYTEVAGLLNLLAIFDAFEGPALRETAHEQASTDQPAPTPAEPAPAVEVSA